MENLPDKKISRRDFLKWLAALGISLSLAGDKPTKEKPRFEPSESILWLDNEKEIEEHLKIIEGRENKSEPTETPETRKTPTETPITIATPEKPITTILTKESIGITTKVIYRGPAGTKKIAITFDDTPSPKIVEELTNFAIKNNVPMVFFIIARTTTPEAAKIIKEGIKIDLIRIGNHSFSHNIAKFSQLNQEYIRKEKDGWINKMKGLGFNEDLLRIYFRPPGGAGGYKGGNKTLLKVLSQNKYQYLCMWDTEFIYTTRVNNLKYNSETLKNITLNRVRTTQGGNLVLAHFNPLDVKAVISAINILKQEGYQFVFPEELF